MDQRGIADTARMASSSSWYSKLEARWGARHSQIAPAGNGVQGLQLRRVPTAAERLIDAPRAAVWAALEAGDEAESSSQLRIVGAPPSGVGARHIHVGPPLPPFGMRSVLYTEVTDVQQGLWLSLRTLAGVWEQTETWVLDDAPGGQTLARITGWWSKPAPPEADLTAQQSALNEMASRALERLAERVRMAADPEAHGGVG